MWRSARGLENLGGLTSPARQKHLLGFPVDLDGVDPDQERMLLVSDVFDGGIDRGLVREFSTRARLGPPSLRCGFRPLLIERPAAIAFVGLEYLLRIGITGDTGHNVNVIRHDAHGDQQPFPISCRFLKLDEQHSCLLAAQSNRRTLQRASCRLRQFRDVCVVRCSNLIVFNSRRTAVPNSRDTATRITGEPLPIRSPRQKPVAVHGDSRRAGDVNPPRFLNRVFARYVRLGFNQSLNG